MRVIKGNIWLIYQLSLKDYYQIEISHPDLQIYHLI